MFQWLKKKPIVENALMVDKISIVENVLMGKEITLVERCSNG